MRVEIVVRFVVEIAEETASKLVLARMFTRPGAIEFVDGAGDDRSDVADADDVVEYASLAVEVVDDPAAAGFTLDFPAASPARPYGKPVRFTDAGTTGEARDDEPIVVLADGSRY